MDEFNPIEPRTARAREGRTFFFPVPRMDIGVFVVTAVSLFTEYIMARAMNTTGNCAVLG